MQFSCYTEELNLAVSHPPIHSLNQQTPTQCDGTLQAVPSCESRDESHSIKALTINCVGNFVFFTFQSNHKGLNQAKKMGNVWRRKQPFIF